MTDETSDNSPTTSTASGGLYEGFEAYRTPTSADYRDLFSTGMLVLDANVLIDLYRYQKATRDEFVKVLEGLKERFWFPHQVVREFWKNRDNIIEDPREVDKTAKNLEKCLNSADGDLRYWAKRVRLPAKYVNDLTAILGDAFNSVIERVRELAVDDGREFARDTNGDPLIVALESILLNRVGPSFNEQEYSAAVTEAQRRGKARIPPGYKDMDKEGTGPAGDYLIWAQVLREAKTRKRDVLFVTSDNKEDWWRKNNKDVSLGPRPELTEELKEVAGVRLFMLPPDGLLDLARDVLRVPISEESVEDVKETSRRVFGEESAEVLLQRLSPFRQHSILQSDIVFALLRMGYEVTSAPLDGGYDLLVQDDDGRSIFVELKYSNSKNILPNALVRQIASNASESSAPVLLITNMMISKQGHVWLSESGVRIVHWHTRADFDKLQEVLPEMFEQMSNDWEY